MKKNPILSSSRLSQIPSYAFAEVDKIVQSLKQKGIEPIDFGVGDPTDPTPLFIRQAAKKAIDTYRASGYPSYIGMPKFRQAVALWYQKRFKVRLDPETEICSNIGSKEAIFNFPEGFINPGDYVLMPNPGYPPYKSGTLFAEGIPYQYPLLRENDFYPDFKNFPQNVLKKAKILWLNYPNSPTGKIASANFYKKAIAFAQKHHLLIASDECYIDLYHKQKPISILEISQKNIVAFHSLSKRSNMTGWRIGFVAGDKKLIEIFKKLKTQIDSGTPNFVQEAAIAALQDEKHVLSSRQNYTRKMKILTNGLKKAGLASCIPEGTFYIWQQVPKGYTSISFAKKLLDPRTAIIVTPGDWISDRVYKINPGQNYIRFALVPAIEKVIEAAAIFKKNTF